MLNNWVKQMAQAIGAILPSRRPPVIVASIGRSGSTLLTRSIREATVKTRFGSFAPLFEKCSKGNGFDLKSTFLENGLVYKTHALPGELSSAKNPKVIFVFGNAADAILSVAQKGEELGGWWVTKHLDNLRASGPFEKVLEEDVLRIEEQIREWGDRDDIERLMIKYDSIWECHGIIEEFLRLKISLPERRERSKKEDLSSVDVEAVRNAYSRLDEWIDSLPGCKVLKKGETLFL